MDVTVHETYPRVTPKFDRLRRNVKFDIGAFLASYPTRVEIGSHDVCHFTAQNLATVLLFQRFDCSTVATVHDIIPFLTRRFRTTNTYSHTMHRLFDLLAMAGLKQSDMLIADSLWTKHTVTHYLGIPPTKVRVVPLGVDLDRFRRSEVTSEWARRFGLELSKQYLVYVGSDDPRKNLDSLIHALARIRIEHPTAHLMMVGYPQHRGQRQRLQWLVNKLSLDSMVSFVDGVTDAELSMFYSACKVVVIPSLFEGFGLPVLESLATGTRVIVADRAALPEVAGADCILAEPTEEGLAWALHRALSDETNPAGVHARVDFASRFTWERTGRETAEIYAELL
jgi:glycosyltransferase involved in cell wall biosynthesis